MSVRVIVGLALLLTAAIAWYAHRRPPPGPVPMPPAVADAKRIPVADSPVTQPAGPRSLPLPAATIDRDVPAESPQQFAMSLAAVDYCERTDWKACREIEVFASQLSEEPREASWATGMEAEIRRAVTVAHPSARVRALECRRTRCALEYIVPAGAPDAIFGELDLAGRLNTVARASLPESDPTQGTFIVTLMTLQAASE